MMKIILLTGDSGTGKTTVAKELSKDIKYNVIQSYTDRPMRNGQEWGHTFITNNDMNVILNYSNIVAYTNINGYHYCATKEQFDNDKINLYIVDAKGVDDIRYSFPFADFMIILLQIESDFIIDAVRAQRKVSLPSYRDVDAVIHNNTTIDFVVEAIDKLVEKDFFTKRGKI